MQIDGVRVFFVADNVALLTARKGLDPRQGYVAAFARKDYARKSEGQIPRNRQGYRLSLIHI